MRIRDNAQVFSLDSRVGYVLFTELGEVEENRG